MIRIWRSAYSRFGKGVEKPDDLLDESVTAEKNYTDEVLKEIVDCGFNAIWLNGQLHHIIANAHFPEFAPNAAVHQKALHTLCARAAKYGIKVFVYIQPPRAIPTSNTEFWIRYMDVGGMTVNTQGDDGSRFDVRAICTSVPYVRDYIRESFADFTKEFPELGGFIIISASEYPAHCYSCYNCEINMSRKPHKVPIDYIPTNCPRCGLRHPEDVVTELLQTIRDGVRSISQTLPLIFWNWSWTIYMDAPCEPIISKLPKDICLLVDFERGGVRRDGVRINEYSLTYAGPSENFLAAKELADRYGIPVMPKFQLGTTHELATVRSLPLIPNIFRKADYMRHHKLDGFMGCWNFGNLPSTSLKAFNCFLEMKEPLSCEEALRKFAEKEYPGSEPSKITAAWNLFCEAGESYPFSNPFLYFSPVNHTLALIPQPGKLSGKPVGRSWLPEERGDVYPEPEEFPLDDLIGRLKRMAEIWKKGVQLLGEAIGKDHPDYVNAAICGAIWQSGYQMYCIYRLRKNWKESMLPEYAALAKAELALSEEILPFVAMDPEQGWHIEGDYHAFSKIMIEKKIQALRDFLKQL